jgi:hypothetical protein
MPTAVTQEQSLAQVAAQQAAPQPTATSEQTAEQPQATGVFRVDIFTGGRWAEVDNFDSEAKAISFAQRVVEVTRHEVSRAVLAGVKIGDIPGVDTEIGVFTKADQEALAAQSQAGESEAEAPPLRRYNLLKIMFYGAIGLVVMLVMNVFGDKLKKIWEFLFSNWLYS